MVIAMGVALSREKNEFDKVRKEPLKLSEFRPKSFKQFYDENEDSDDFWNEDGSEKKKEKKPEANEFDEF
jgi:hypothetical protein